MYQFEQIRFFKNVSSRDRWNVFFFSIRHNAAAVENVSHRASQIIRYSFSVASKKSACSEELHNMSVAIFNNEPNLHKLYVDVISTLTNSTCDTFMVHKMCFHIKTTSKKKKSPNQACPSRVQEKLCLLSPYQSISQL